MSLDVPLFLSLTGLAVFCYRLRVFSLAREVGSKEDATAIELPVVSIIVPCRNEVANLPTLLGSLRALDYPQAEIIIVDDASTDGTFDLATKLLRDFPRTRVLRAPPKPASWGGKNWPCHIGALEATGSYLLFTDADTFHARDSLKKAMTFLVCEKLQMITAVPFHRCQRRWEKCLGLFHLLPLIATAYAEKPRVGRVFAIGQYLLFNREIYVACGGHAAVSSSLAEDIDLAELCLRRNLRYGVFKEPGIFEVQMYDSFEMFWLGWKRLLRLGLFRSTLLSVFEVTAVCYAFTLSWLEMRTDLIALSIVAAALLALLQRRHGRFAIFGALFSFASVLLFVALTLAAVVEALLKRNIQWHGRSYSSHGSLGD